MLFVWMFLILVPLFGFLFMQMRFSDHVVARTRKGLTSAQLAELTGRNVFSGLSYSLRAGPSRFRALFRPSGFPELETERRVTVTFLALTFGAMVAPFPYTALRHRGLTVEESLGAMAILAFTIYGVVLSATQLLPGRRSAGQQRLAGALGVLAFMGVLAFWYWYFVLSR